MASYEYTVVIDGETQSAEGRGYGAKIWTHATAVEWIRRALYGRSGSVGEIWRRREGSRGHGQQHRRYEVGADGIVRRTDRQCSTRPAGETRAGLSGQEATTMQTISIQIPIVPMNFIRARLVRQGVVSIHEAASMSPGEVRAAISRGLLHTDRTAEECAAACEAYEAATRQAAVS